MISLISFTRVSAMSALAATRHARGAHALRALAASLAAAALVLSSIAAPPAVQAQGRGLPGVPAGPEVGINLDLLRDIQAQTAVVRGLPVRADVPVQVMSQQEYGRLVREAAIVPEEEREALDAAARTSPGRRLLLLLGLVTAETDLRGISTQVASERIAGLYSSRLDAMLLITSGAGVFGLSEQNTYSHEYVHALQHGHYDLVALQRRATDGDMRQAIRALIEGDATFTAGLWAHHAYGEEEVDRLGNEEREVRREREAQATRERREQGLPAPARPAALPQYIQLQSQFTYTTGTRFVADAYRRTMDFSAVEQVYANPPRSTEQVLHPEKYWSQEAPLPVELPHAAETLGDGWEELFSDVAGEFDLLQVLLEHANRQAAATAAAGWGGGRYALLERNGDPGQTALVIRTAWDTALDAREFYDVYAHGLRVRFPDAQVDWATDERQALTAGDFSTELRLQGDEVLLVVSHDRASVEALAAVNGF
jgi:hypothetical protein